MPRRFCIDCPAVFDKADAPGQRCPSCQATADAARNASSRAYDRTRRKPRGTTTARGYGTAYQRERAALKATASACHWCGAPFTEQDPFTADHDPPLARGGTERQMVAAHRSCNSSRGGKLRRST